MIKAISTSGHTTYGIKEYVLDTEEEINELPLSDPMGSTAFIIENSVVYMMNGKKEWTKLL